MKKISATSRRSFLEKGLVLTSAMTLTGFGINSSKQDNITDEGIYLVGPKKGYDPLIGTLVSMLENMTSRVKENIKDFTQEQLDYKFDEKANTIGSLILHITSSEKYHQVETFYGRSFNEEELKFWAPARSLGEEISKSIKGHDVGYYLNIMDEVRQESLSGLKSRDDKWLLGLDEIESSADMPVNRFYRWFHACEHMSNHNGQIKFLKSRLPV